MKTYRILLCLALLAVWAELPASGQDWKPGICPQDNTWCMDRKLDQCAKDIDCEGQKKCCFIACAKRCVFPMKVKPGSCPLDPTACLPGRPVLCHSDYECSGPKKCCSFECVVQCKDPAKV